MSSSPSISQRAVVTGASGFIGSAVVRALLAQGWAVAALARPDSHLARLGGDVDRVTVIRGRLAEPESYRAALADFAPAVAIHCAWDGISGATRDSIAQATNYVDSLAFLDACRQAGAGSWIGLGSQAEYGVPDRRLDEAQPCAPTTLYGAVKLATGQTAGLAAAKAGMRFAWVRVFHVYGPGDSPTFMVPALIEKLLAGERPALTAGTQIWDLLHVDDAAAAIVHIAAHPDLEGVFNLGSGDPRTIRAIAEDVRDAVDPALPLGFGEVAMAPNGPTHLEADIGRLRASGWSPAIPWTDGVAATVAWHRARKEQS
ncbi:NAD(P)-dependent oxidoreductase [Magnetospirillum sp. UT-4]|uniref:NAD-dependent epimerase/dehydratase family protein n=1 Tax=Magnetospirillum sp. UT-4 TaxID=2681467 RepID=UPI00137D6B2C|nr:NAD(P)-dependent oxidoreductase [Magnetospirillum sp. UT-4]CAA7621643.1 Nucleoside-diphosphate-sugar epimerases [Magnetospirillum sp. UT-4]